MRYLFLVQGEGRGHMTQAISLKQQLEANGHEVCSILVGKSEGREIPSFFHAKTKKTIIEFNEPSFIRTKDKKGVKLFPSIIYNLFRTNFINKQLQIIHRAVKDSRPDVIINFYCISGGLYAFFYRPKTYTICIAHQYMFLHPEYKFPAKFGLKKLLLKTLTHLTALKSDKKLALSFYPKQDIPAKQLYVVPPLLRSEIFHLKPKNKNYLLCYILNEGYQSEIIKWQEQNNKQTVHLFGDIQKQSIHTIVQDNMYLHPLDDAIFLKHLERCSAYASTAGFESICEAMYLEKPVFLIPTRGHIEQQCNAFDTVKVGAGITSESFDLSKLLAFIPQYQPNPQYREWVHRSQTLFNRHLAYISSEKHYNGSATYQHLGSLVPG